jgi:hypothetical protein
MKLKLYFGWQFGVAYIYTRLYSAHAHQLILPFVTISLTNKHSEAKDE